MIARRGQSGTGFAALLALLAVFVLALAPAIAMAHDVSQNGSSIVICSTDGAKAVVIGADGVARSAPAKGLAGLKCSQCLGATLAATLADPGRVITPVRYAALAPLCAPRVLGVRGHARAPPRPPGQGPPLLLNA
jgi:hypothetical protein